MTKINVTSIQEVCAQCKNEEKEHTMYPENEISHCKFDLVPAVRDKEVWCSEFLTRTKFTLVKKKLLQEDKE